MTRYWTDREYGEQPRKGEEIDERVWAGLRSRIETGIADGSFGYRFPEECPDGGVACGCDREAFGEVLKAEVPWIEWPLRQLDSVATPVILDALEFCAGAVGEPIEKDYHSYWRHHHLSWNRESGLARFVTDVNVILARNGIAYELTAEGQVRRLLAEPLAEAVRWARFHTGDAETDGLLEAASRRIALPKEEDRRDALEKLWDAFERLKTLEPGLNKRSQADALLDRAASQGTRLREMLGEEAMALTNIGNRFRIRHSEVDQEKLSSPEAIDYVFGRMFGFLRMVLKATGRGG